MKLEVKNGCFSYKKRVKENAQKAFTKNDKSMEEAVLKDINFTVEGGEMAAILGPNGAGKTTLLRCIMGLLPWKSGRSMLDCVNIAEIPTRELWKRIAYVPQAKNTVTAFSVREMVLLGRSSHLKYLENPKKMDYQKADEVIERMQITKLADKKCCEISGGELQMVLIARAMAAEPEILILDEPESNLDYRNQLLVLDTMSGLVMEGMTCIFNTHYPVHALQRADKALLLSKNAGYLFGETGKVINERNIETAFGVKSVIGEIETPVNMQKDVIPYTIVPKERGLLKDTADQENKSNIAVISILLSDDREAVKVNEYLHEFRDFVVGRMGMAYRKGNVRIINVTVDASESRIKELYDKLNRLTGISVKTTYRRE